MPKNSDVSQFQCENISSSDQVNENVNSVVTNSEANGVNEPLPDGLVDSPKSDLTANPSAMEINSVPALGTSIGSNSRILGDELEEFRNKTNNATPTLGNQGTDEINSSNVAVSETNICSPSEITADQLEEFRNKTNSATPVPGNQEKDEKDSSNVAVSEPIGCDIIPRNNQSATAEQTPGEKSFF